MNFYVMKYLKRTKKPNNEHHNSMSTVLVQDACLIHVKTRRLRWTSGHRASVVIPWILLRIPSQASWQSFIPPPTARNHLHALQTKQKSIYTSTTVFRKPLGDSLGQTNKSSTTAAINGLGSPLRP